MPDIATPGGIEKWRTWLQTDAGYALPLPPHGATTQGYAFAGTSTNLPPTYRTGRPTPNVARTTTPHRADRTPCPCPGWEATESSIRQDQAHLGNHNAEEVEALVASARDAAVQAAINDGRQSAPCRRPSTSSNGNQPKVAKTSHCPADAYAVTESQCGHSNPQYGENLAIAHALLPPPDADVALAGPVASGMASDDILDRSSPIWPLYSGTSVLTTDPATMESRMKCQCLCPPSTCDCRPAKGNLWRCQSHCRMLVCMRCIAIEDPIICHCCYNDSNDPAAPSAGLSLGPRRCSKMCQWSPTQVTNADGTWRRADGSDTPVNWQESCIDQYGKVFV